MPTKPPRRAPPTKEDRRQVLINLLSYYCSKNHIHSRGRLREYLVRVKKEMPLTEKMMKHFLSFARRDLDATDTEILAFFEEFYIPSHKYDDTAATLPI